MLRFVFAVFQVNSPRQRGPLVCPKLCCGIEQHHKALRHHSQPEMERLMSACEPVVDSTAVGGWGSGECCLHLCGKQIMVECLPNRVLYLMKYVEERGRET